MTAKAGGGVFAGGAGARWELVSPYTAPQMPLMPETWAQANKQLTISLSGGGCLFFFFPFFFFGLFRAYGGSQASG